MANKTSILTVLSLDAVKVLKQEGVITKHDSFDSIPLPFKEVIREYLLDFIGFDSGPIYGLARLNGEMVSLRDNAFNGEVSVTDILPVVAGEVIFELSVPVDVVVYIGMNKLFELIAYARDFGEDNELVLGMLKSALSVGTIETDEEHVLAFIPKIWREECARLVRLDEKWNSDFSDALSNIEAVTPATLSKF